MLDAELAKYLMNPSERVMHDRKRLFVCSSVITVVLSINYRDATHRYSYKHAETLHLYYFNLRRCNFFKQNCVTTTRRVAIFVIIWTFLQNVMH